MAWTQGGTPTAPTYTCAGTERSVLDGPPSNTAPLTSPASLAAGGVDNLVFTYLAARDRRQHVPGQDRRR